jgi:nitrate reductase gamma subunit
VGGSVIGLLAMLFLLVLLLRRLALERPRWISTFSDYFALVLLLLIVITGNQMRFTSHFDLLQSRRFVAGWLGLHPVAAPHELWFTAHILLISTLLIYIPFSKLVHAGGATLLSPTLNQMNDPRIRRHINPWDPTPAAKRPTPP